MTLKQRQLKGRCDMNCGDCGNFVRKGMRDEIFPLGLCMWIGRKVAEDAEACKDFKKALMRRDSQ